MSIDLFADVRGQRSASAGKNPRNKLKEIQQLVEKVRPDDGLDPRYASSGRSANDPARPGRTHGEHKQAQLFSQIKDAVDVALLAAHNPLLYRLAAANVVASGGSLAIVVHPRDPADRVDVPAATEALEAARSMLRREIAAATTRKETPSLQFIVLPTFVDDVET